jgi:DNA-binding GntR family transcriptional regulator
MQWELRSLGQVRYASGSRFLYQSVTDELRSRIVTGAYARGVRIPSVEELAAEFAVSSITIRRAIRDLSLGGLLVGRQGLGNFVVDEKPILRSINPGRLTPIEDDMRAAGVEAGLNSLGISVVSPADERFLSCLGVPRLRLYRLERLLLADGKAVGFDTLWLPRTLADKLKDHLDGQFIMSLLTKYGIEVDHVRYQFEATTASEAQGPMLNVVTGYPLLVIRFFPIGADGRTILAGRNVTRADRFTYEFVAQPNKDRFYPSPSGKSKLLT